MQLNKASFSFCCHLFIEAEQGIPCMFLSEAKGRKGPSNTLLYSSFALTSCNTKPQRGVTMVASRFNGWYIAARKKRAFRYATSNSCRVPTARYPSTSSLPAIKMAGYHCQMPTASLTKLELLYY